MTANYDKLWLQDSLNQTAIQRASTIIKNTGRALPCKVTAVNGSIVTVSFEVNSAPLTLPQVTIPKAESNWIRMPTQVGDFGVTMPADAYLSAIAGMGGGTPTLKRPHNLAALVFVPISNKGAPPIDPDAAQVQGPNGAIIRTTEGDNTSSIVTDQNGTTITYGDNTVSINDSSAQVSFGSSTFTVDGSSITMTAGGKTLTINSSGITLDGKLWEMHAHTGVTTGSGTSGPPA